MKKLRSLVRLIINQFKSDEAIRDRLNNIQLTNGKVVGKENLKINGVIKIDNKGKLSFGTNCTINSGNEYNPVGMGHETQFYLSHNAEVIIGNNVGISNSLFFSQQKIQVEDDVMFGGGCQIFDTDFHSIQYSNRILNGDNHIKTKPVLIKKGAFVGCNSIVLKGVTIGEMSVIGAGSVVRNDIPANEIWAGNPAVFISKINN
ncbi:MAG: acyltransferase [Bacteroidetes bacterium]|nr:acyltransferase [Bacteroidota bacterium]